MIPILFRYDETDFTTHGLGDLIDATGCIGRQTSEGEYELSFNYPSTGDLFPELQVNRIVLAKVNNWDSPQRFRIYGVESGINQMLTVNCQHISYDLTNYPVRAFKDQLSPSGVISELNSKIMAIDPQHTELCPFTISGYTINNYSQIPYQVGEYAIYNGDTWQCVFPIDSGEAWNESKWNKLDKFDVDEPKSARSILLDGDDSVLGFYGGDLILNNTTFEIQKSAGRDTDTIIEYGVDLVDLKQDRNISERVTGILPFWKGTIRDSTTGYYETDTSSGFVQGTIYFERIATYGQTSDAHYNPTKKYFVLSGGVYSPVSMSTLGFKEDGTQYYVWTAVIDPETGLYTFEYVQVYPVDPNNPSNPDTPSDPDAPSGQTGYLVLNTEPYDSTRDYFIEDGVNSITRDPLFRLATMADFGFVDGQRYYERVQQGTDWYGNPVWVYSETTEPYDSSKIESEYFIENGIDPATGWMTYRQATNDDFGFVDGVRYWVYITEQDTPTPIPPSEMPSDFILNTDPYDSSQIYYIENGTDPSTGDPIYRLATMDDFGFADGQRYYERMQWGTDWNGHPVWVYYETTEPYDSSKIGSGYYVIDEENSANGAISYRQAAEGDFDFVDGTDYWIGIYSEDPNDEPDGEDITVGAASENSSSNESNHEELIVSAASVGIDTSTEYFVLDGTVYRPIQASDLDFITDPTTVYYEEISATFTPTSDQTPNPNKAYYTIQSNSYSEEETIIYGDIQYADGVSIYSQGAQRIESVNLSEFFDAETEEELPTKDSINKKARQWMLANHVGEPTVNLTVQYANFGQDIRLYDAITVRFVKLGIDVRAKVTSYSYDVLKERITEISVANVKSMSAWSTLEDASRLRHGLLRPERVGNKSITSEKYAPSSVDEAAIGTKAVHDWHIGDEDITTRTIAKEAVEEEKIKNRAVTVNKIEDGAVTTEKIEDGAVIENKILDQAVTLSKMWGEFQVFYTNIIAALAIFSDYVKVERALECSVLYVRNSQIMMGAVNDSVIYEPTSITLNIPTSLSGGWSFSAELDSGYADLDDGSFTYYYTSYSGSNQQLVTTPFHLYYIGKRMYED